MRIHMIGHASIFVETEDCNIMMDPVLFDPSFEGGEDIFPKRKVIYEQIPEFDVLVISNQYLDHFDIRSLVSVPKHIDVFIPQDKFLKICLSKLGYSNIHYLKDESTLKIGSTHLITTGSENRIPEFGVLFADPSGVFWNQADTNVSLQTIHHVKSCYSQIDFVLAPWQPLLEADYQVNGQLSFPYSAYSKWLDIIDCVKPKAIAPGANNLKYVKNASWLNQAAFSVTREQFCKNIKVVCPEVEDNVFEPDPGDIFAVENGKFNHAKGKSQIIKKLGENREELDFSPINISENFLNLTFSIQEVEILDEKKKFEDYVTNVDDTVCD